MKPSTERRFPKRSAETKVTRATMAKFFFVLRELLYGKLGNIKTRCKGRSDYSGLVDFDEFVREKGRRPGSDTTHGGLWRGRLSSHHANKRPLGVGFRERRGKELLPGGTQNNEWVM